MYKYVQGLNTILIYPVNINSRFQRLVTPKFKENTINLSIFRINLELIKNNNNCYLYRQCNVIALGCIMRAGAPITSKEISENNFPIF
jgi:hypothetical protein